jgi:uncharacterized protein
VQTLREQLYVRLAPTANRWVARLKPGTSSATVKPRPPKGRSGQAPEYPGTLEKFLRQCRTAGQGRPTPLLLSYGAGGYNCLHQDIYGALAFPLQVVLMLSRRDQDYTGGEFLLVEQRPRAQSRGHAIAVDQGAGVIFSTRERPAEGTRGPYRVAMRHGVSTVTSGARMTLGLIFHDAR